MTPPYLSCALRLWTDGPIVSMKPRWCCTQTQCDEVRRRGAHLEQATGGKKGKKGTGAYEERAAIPEMLVQELYDAFYPSG